ncbi:unnamed protein product, partial [Polarella glacialis]
AGVPDAMPPVAKRLMEAVVNEQVEGLGECLRICAHRSRTLKLLGFQHLHFDARLQTFLESRATGVVQPVADALLMARALMAFREVTRHGFLWQKLSVDQQKLRAHNAK